jgi:hypothetical protein
MKNNIKIYLIIFASLFVSINNTYSYTNAEIQAAVEVMVSN